VRHVGIPLFLKNWLMGPMACCDYDDTPMMRRAS